jgi:hypothetical protein
MRISASHRLESIVYTSIYIYRLVSSLNPHLINPHSGASSNLQSFDPHPGTS